MHNRIAAERKLAGLTQVECASAIGVNETTLVRYEADGPIPSDKLILLRKIFKCDIDWILGLSNIRHSIEDD